MLALFICYILLMLTGLALIDSMFQFWRANLCLFSIALIFFDIIKITPGDQIFLDDQNVVVSQNFALC